MSGHRTTCDWRNCIYNLQHRSITHPTIGPVIVLVSLIWATFFSAVISANDDVDVLRAGVVAEDWGGQGALSFFDEYSDNSNAYYGNRTQYQKKIWYANEEQKKLKNQLE